VTSVRAEGFGFRTLATSGNARAGVMTTPHGEVETPIFMPVGTQGSVKTLDPLEVASTGAKVVLGNTYHLWLRPGPELIAKLGGLHGFTRWPHAMLTDSGGFQAYSLGAAKGDKSAARAMVIPDDDGFTFRSHLDGSKHHLSPEEAVRVQGLLGADIQMQLDVCPPGQSPRAVVEAAVAQTTRWARRALASPRPRGQALFGIVQGATHVDLRKAHAEELGALDYLMGVGTPRDVLEAIEHGIDMMDCVLPTRNARNGQALTRHGRIVVKQARYKDDPRPLDESCSCRACAGGFSRAYLRHLYLAGEILVLKLLSLHNLHFYGELTEGARVSIRAGTFPAYKAALLASMAAGS
jgi:queuine tRNA-ribosyltransferase